MDELLNLKSPNTAMYSRLLSLVFLSLVASAAFAEEPGSVSQALLQMENPLPIEGKMTAVFTGDKVRLSIQGGPVEIPLGEHSSHESANAGRTPSVPSGNVPRALGAASLDDMQYDRFGRDLQDLSQENRYNDVGRVGPLWSWVPPAASYVHGGLFGHDPALATTARSALSRKQIRSLKSSPASVKVLPMQARIGR